MFSFEKDRFGNLIHYLDTNDNNFNIMYEIVQNNSNDNLAIVFNNVTEQDCNMYNRIASVNKKITWHKKLNMGIVRNNSPAPTLYNDEILAGGVNLLVNHEDEIYTILMQDKTKNYLTVCGGTFNTDIDTREPLPKNIYALGVTIGLRELYEESGIIIKKAVPFAQINFNTKYFGHSINDTYIMSKKYCNSNSNDVLNNIFKKENFNNSSYSKIYDNNETEYIHAINLNKHSFNEILENDILKNFKHPVTTLHMYLSIIHANSLGLLKIKPNFDATILAKLPKNMKNLLFL